MKEGKRRIEIWFYGIESVGVHWRRRTSEGRKEGIEEAVEIESLVFGFWILDFGFGTLGFEE